MSKTVLVSLLCLLFAANGVFAQDCAKFQVIDLYSSSSDYSSYERIKDVVCTSETRDSGSARDFGLKAGIPIQLMDDVLSLNFGATNSGNDWSSWKSNFCHSHYSDVVTQLKQSNLAQVFSDNAREVVKSCLQQAVYGYFEVPAAGDGFSFTLQVQGTEKLKGAELLDPSAVTNCSAKNPFGLGFLDYWVTDVDISGKKEAFGCSWDQNKLVQVKVRLRNQGDRVFQLQPIKKIPPAPPQPPPEPPKAVVIEDKTYKSPDYPSGNYANWSPYYQFCSPDEPDGWTVQKVRFEIGGDRASGWNHFNLVSQTDRRVCYQFQMQGHNDTGDDGVRISWGIMTVTWKHLEPAPK
jgi:hypothetical protein